MSEQELNEQLEDSQDLSENRSYFYVFLRLLPVLVIVVLAGFSFALYTSEPEFENKTQELLYKKSVHPKYVIVIPDNYKRQQVIEEFNDKNDIVEDIIKDKAIEETDVVDLSEVQKQEETEVLFDDKADRYSYPRRFQNDIDDYKPSMNDSLLPVAKTVDEVISLTPSVDNIGSKSGFVAMSEIEPLNDLQINDAGNILPKVSDEGHKPWMVYSKEITVPQKFHKVVVVFKNMGTNKQYIDAAIRGLPQNITLSFSPYAKNLEELIEKARNNGHETYLDLLFEPQDYPINDIGNLGVTSLDSLVRNLEILDKNMNVDAAYGGFISNRGGDFMQTDKRMIPIYQTLADRGLLFVDGSGGKATIIPQKTHLAHKVADLVIDKKLYRETILEKLKYAEELARHYGDVLIIVEPKPITFVLIKEWIDSFSQPVEEDENIEYEKPFMLVPVSSIVTE